MSCSFFLRLRESMHDYVLPRRVHTVEGKAQERSTSAFKGIRDVKGKRDTDIANFDAISHRF